MLKITLFSNNPELCEYWQNDFEHERNVAVCNTDYYDLPKHDCIVSPANSYGIMDGGLDLLIRDELGVHVQDRVQWHINRHFNGCQPIGTSIIVEAFQTFDEIRSKRFKFLAHTPTMQYPQNIQGSLNTMHSFCAALMTVNQRPNISSVACSGMGAGVGEVPPNEVSKQMHLAYKLYLENMSKECYYHSGGSR